MSDVGDYNIIYDSEDFSILSPSYLDSSDSVTDQEGIDGENEEVFSNTEVDYPDYTDYYNNIIDNQLLIQSQVDNLNENIIVLNDNLKIMCGLNFALCAGIAIFIFWRILNNLLGIGKA